MHILKKILILIFILHFNAVFADNININNQAIRANKSEYFKVISVEPDDTLNLRSSASGKSNAVFKLPHNASGLLKIKESNGWVKLSYKNHTGWAYKKYLKKIKVPGIKSEISSELFCIGTEPHWILNTRNNNLIYKKYDDEAIYTINSAGRTKSEKKESWLYSAIKLNDANSSINIVITQNDQCTDEMSDNKYSYSISLEDNEMGMLNGCCNKK